MRSSEPISGAGMSSGSGKRRSAVSPQTIGDITIFIAREPLDFRLGINGLSVVIEATLRIDEISRCWRADAGAISHAGAPLDHTGDLMVKTISPHDHLSSAKLEDQYRWGQNCAYGHQSRGCQWQLITNADRVTPRDRH